ncbi:TlpA family protein disulfide reductase [bacterium]|nr:TlpA family protein disulfide reductase [bacterium]
MRTSKIIVISAVAVAMLSLWGCGSSSKGEGEQSKKIPEFEVVGFDGKKYSSKMFRRGVGIISFVTSWCGPCGYELIELDSLARKFGKKVSVLALTYESPDLFRRMLDSLKVSVPIARCDTALFAEFGVDRLPARFLVKDGRVIATVVGAPAPPDTHFTNAFLSAVGYFPDSSKNK